MVASPFHVEEGLAIPDWQRRSPSLTAAQRMALLP
jgi:hypothetical protein